MEIESLIARMDAVLTTRLHGLALAVKNGVPVLAIDPVHGGAKISRQAETIGWPVVFAAEAMDDQKLRDALEYCLSGAARIKARECAENARRVLQEAQNCFITEFRRETLG